MINRSWFLTLSASAPFALRAGIARADATSMPETLLGWARTLVSQLTPERNIYASDPTYVEWTNAATGTAARNRSVCSSFASHLLEKSFGYTPHDIDAWFGKRVPQAVEYHDTITAAKGFTLVGNIDEIQAGDIIAVAYPPGNHPTGHVMIVDSSAVRRNASEPLEPHTHQYEIKVIDSANSGHGRADTRRRDDGGWNTGVGRGTLRLYAHHDGTIAGYAWSDFVKSRFRPVSERPIAIGRLDPATVPKPSGSAGTAPPPDDDGVSADSTGSNE